MLADYFYDGDGGNMVKTVVNDVVTFYPGRHYNEEVDNSVSTVKKFYTLGSTTVAVRTITDTENTLNWVLGDHLGSTSVTANEDGSWNSEIKYSAFGDVRTSRGLTPTEYRYTGQMEHSYIKLYWYRSRWYDGELAHFIQPDSIIPGAGDALSYDRYAYVKSNPINFTDPTGHYEFMNTPDDGYFIPATPGIMSARRSTYPNAYSSDERIRLIYRKAHIIKAKEEGSLGSFKELLEYSTSLYNEHENLDFMSDFSCVINGYCKGKEKLGGIWKIGKPDWFPNAQGGPYYIGADFFKGKGAWSSLYHDYTDNQMYHFWFYVALSYADGKGFANLGNYAHGDRQNSPWVTARGQTEGGVSQQDYLLSLVGIELVRSIARGKVQLSELGKWVHQALSVPIAGR